MSVTANRAGRIASVSATRTGAVAAAGPGVLPHLSRLNSAGWGHYNDRLRRTGFVASSLPPRFPRPPAPLRVGPQAGTYFFSTVPAAAVGWVRLPPLALRVRLEAPRLESYNKTKVVHSRLFECSTPTLRASSPKRRGTTQRNYVHQKRLYRFSP
jgi:hypothetical protein